MRAFDSNGELDILEEIKDEMCEKLSERMRDTAYSEPSTGETHLYNYMVQSLVDRGLADSRAVKIVRALTISRVIQGSSVERLEALRRTSLAYTSR